MSYGQTAQNTLYGLKYSEIHSTHLDQVWHVIPARYRSKFMLSFMEINTIVMPHVDDQNCAKVNFYLETANCSTEFFNLRGTNCKFDRIPGQTNGYMINPRHLVRHSSFIAQSGDAYALDTSRPHAVIPQGNDQCELRRTAVVLSTLDVSFQDLLGMLRETSSI